MYVGFGPTCHQGILGPSAEPVHGASGDESGELEGPRAEPLPDGREAQYHVQVLADTAHEVLIQVLIGGRSPRELPLHHRDEVAEDLVDLVSSKQVRHLRDRKTGHNTFHGLLSNSYLL